MTLEQAGERYHISVEKLKSYEKSGLLRHRAGTDGIFDYTEAELCRAGLIHSLLKAGLDRETLKTYLELPEDDAGSRQERLHILRKARGRLLEDIHEKQQSLDEIDYMIGKIRKNQGGNRA